ncbi:MAG: isoprenylcysteine carboxylmethyltransferase family protein [Anaerolineae bacterium]|nr:isoprenylcysteine carboxylmethyltransferase family protein [Anaerolineae bacterium]
MSAQVQATMTLITWGVLMTLYALNKYVIKHDFLKSPILVDLSAVPISRPGSFIAGAGVLFTFVSNIATIGVVFGCALSPSFENAVRFLRFNLPLWVNVACGVLFVLNSLWGLLVLFYNPNYTPLYKQLRGHYIIVTEGPYRLVRHPRYAAEALANLIFFLFTGVWLSLLGILGWAAIYAQGKAEEQFLLALSPQAYGDYRRRTGMFFPQIRQLTGPR